MRKNIIFKKPSIYKVTAVFFYLLSLLSLLASPAHAIRFTHIRHLFDITGNFSEPSDVSVSKDGLIYVVDGVNNSIKVFNQSGRPLYSFGKSGSGNGEFRFPLGIDVDISGRVYVADSGNHRIQVFNSNGGFVTQISVPSKNGNPSDPTDVAVDKEHEKLYVVDNNNHYILAYDLAADRLIQTFGSPGTEKREFRFPFLMALDKDKYLYIVDVINTRVQVLNPEGLFVTSIGGWGVEKGEFFRPKGVAVDKNNRVYVSDSYMGVIQIFDSTGEFYSALGDLEKGTVKKFKTPTGIFIDNNNRLYVVEMFAQKVSVYSIESDSE